ncbi:MAG: phosphatidate cytidylyltransferase [Alistipes sp.]
MSEKMKNLAVRTISGLILAAVVIGAMLFSKWSFGALLLVLLVGGMREIYHLSAKCNAEPQYLMGMVSGAVLLIINFLAATQLWANGEVMRLLTLYFIVMLTLLFVCELFRKSKNPLANIGATLLGVVYVALPLSLMCYIPTISGIWQPWIMIFFIFIIWSNDVFAYLVGMSIGRHRLCERLSPKKSWEGFFGGVAGAVAMGVVAANLLDANVWQWLGLAFVASITGVLGDLTESMFKRAAEVKDSGNAIPGHGGWLDRFDALLLAAPFVFAYMVLIDMI